MAPPRLTIWCPCTTTIASQNQAKPAQSAGTCCTAAWFTRAWTVSMRVDTTHRHTTIGTQEWCLCGSGAGLVEGDASAHKTEGRVFLSVCMASQNSEKKFGCCPPKNYWAGETRLKWEFCLSTNCTKQNDTQDSITSQKKKIFFQNGHFLRCKSISVVASLFCWPIRMLWITTKYVDGCSISRNMGSI